MHIKPSARTAAIVTSFALSLLSSPAISQGLPPEPPVEKPAAAAPPPAADDKKPAAQAAPSEYDMPAIAPGPFEDRRKKLLETIITAKGYGFGISAYMQAFTALEDRVKANASENEIKGRLDSIVNNLEEQLKRSQQLKIQKPAPPISASSPPPSSMIPSGISKAIQSGKADGLVDKIKNQWFGGEIPDSIKKKIPPGFDPNSIDPNTARELMKKYGGGQ